MTFAFIYAMFGFAVLSIYAGASRVVLDPTSDDDGSDDDGSKNVRNAGLGEPCVGSGFFSNYKGNCAANLHAKCYDVNDGSSHAKSGQPGTCWVSHRKQCRQSKKHDESSGYCRESTVCRLFRYQYSIASTGMAAS